ncbi:MAG: SGNH/GDSL hydrolase family protein [Deltaproteobacteria bacterium]|nr:SGNH/GDSL hydrolase family protein [Deltaproteobacteria bacterium]
MSRGREILFGAVLITFGLGLAFGLLEVGVRMSHLVPDRFWEPDEVLGSKLIPGAQGWWTQEEREFVVPVRINHEGLRDVEHAYEKPAAVYRVLLLGDSFVEAMHVPLEATIGRQLEARLNAVGAARHVEVIAAGVSSYGTAGELLYLRKEGQRYRPDLILLAFYPGNDVKNNSPSLEDYLKPEYSSDGEIQRVIPAKKELAGGAKGLLARSKGYQFLRQLILVRQPRIGQFLVRTGLMRADAVRQAPQRDGIPADYGVYAASVNAEWQDAWQHTLRLLDEMHGEAESAGAQFGVLILSTRDHVYPQSWKEIMAANPAMQKVDWNLEGPRQRVEEWCAKQSVACLALAPEFYRVAQSGGEALHFMQDGHWTAAGHKLAAGLVANFVNGQFLHSRQ